MVEKSVDGEIEKQLDSLNNEFENLKARISDLRKNGKDIGAIIDESQYFHLCDGQTLKCMGDLAGSIEHDMSEEVFNHHCNTEKNDFMLWIMNVIGNQKLAKSIRNVRTKRTMLKKIKKGMSK